MNLISMYTTITCAMLTMKKQGEKSIPNLSNLKLANSQESIRNYMWNISNALY